MIDAAELAAWLRLLLAPGLGRDLARRLLASFGDPQLAVQASTEQLRQVGGTLAERLAQAPEDLEDHVQRTLAWLAQGEGRAVVTLGDPHYPPALLETADPPLLLFAQGQLGLLQQRRAVAIVGSRQATPQGLENAREFAAHFSRAGLVVVSGLALGIDGAAHDGALQGTAGTIAVVGTGLDRVYPKRHLALAHRIAEHGLLLSEFPLDTPPLQQNFPMRNRIIAGLSLGTLVVEAAPQSGSLITARLAAEMGREVFAIPGSIHSPQARGCHALIKQGAKLVETAEDVLEELRLQHRSPAVAAATADENEATEPTDPLLAAIGHDPVTLDTLVARTGWPAHELSARLLELELEGQVQRLPGGLYQRVVFA
jgi:DNA processing protein